MGSSKPHRPRGLSPEWVELVDQQTAREEAMRRILEILDAEVRAGIPSDVARVITVTDAAGAVLFEIAFTEVLRGRKARN